MPATVIINRWTGASSAPTKTAITSGNTVANANDTHTATAAGSADPIRIPSAGTNYSYWVSTRLSASTSPTGSITNIKWYATGNNFGTGVGAIGNQGTAYVTAVGTQGTTGNILSTASHAGLAGSAPVDVFTYTSVLPRAIGGTLGSTATGDFGSFFIYQVTVGTGAQPGTTGPSQFNWTYDET